NGHVIMLMSPVVNGDTPTAQCETEGYVAGFFDEEDFDPASDPNSNQGEIFYSVVPDPTGAYSCTHTVSDLQNDVPAVFLHELQHLIDFGTHVIKNGGQPESSWLDEGLSIVAEELGSLHYESQCPPPSCRTNPAQLFPDSSQGFISDFFYDGYEYALLPDTASLTLHTDSDDGFAWRGGDWQMMRYLADQFGTSVYKKLENGVADGITNIQNVTGQPFNTTLANFGMALYTDSLPGLPRTTAPMQYRFVTRNMRQLWNRLYTTTVAEFGVATSDVPYAMPLYLYPITTDTTSSLMDPGTMSFYRLDTPSGSATVTIRFSAPGGVALQPLLHPQLSIYRLPPGQ
ncbi:MAG TPA: hypothetical protein VMH39_07835, partial [Gemmatimonadaceae bacterium]|nr:hypothetical protein [Gemmatimonadaceae bacterium]